RLHGSQFCFRLREESLITLPEIRWLLVAALQQETEPPLTTHVHRKRKDRVAKLLFSTKLVIEPRLNNLSEHRTLRGAGKFVITCWDKYGGQRGVGTAPRFFENHILLFLNQHILVTAPFVTF